MKITKDIEIKDLCLYIKKEKMLVLADVHMGYEEALNKQGILVPRQQFKLTMERLERTVEKLSIDTTINTIIINGDVKHEFGTISDTEWRHTLKLIDYLAEHCKRLILLRGNHDTILGPVAGKRNIEVAESLIIGEKLICHGHEIPEEAKLKGIKTIIIAHEHPAVSIADYPRVETYKCFLAGKWQRKQLIVMPSFNLVTEGTDILKEKLLSPFLKQDLADFNVFIVSDKIYDFGKVKDIKKLS